jgi:4-hydroxy-3-methylbut-2-enyl diphosphate reductase
MPVYFIKDASEILSEKHINHFVYADQKLYTQENWLPSKEKVNIVVTSGASCPDTVVEEVLRTVLNLFPGVQNIENVLQEVTSK